MGEQGGCTVGWLLKGGGCGCRVWVYGRSKVGVLKGGY